MSWNKNAHERVMQMSAEHANSAVDARGILICMQDTTTVRVSGTTRDAIRSLALADGLTIDAEIEQLARAERQRRFGRALAVAPTEDENLWLNLGGSTVVDDERG
ncbi:MAG TPA: hypothetical protein PK020_14390 [Ilumatobacteraceae bacterium]|nr:hypothetical protein [Ilumatobacteraceae bacterium]HRB04010.1 hypothetical protein [Ilumatobacteraceae bacterium]